MNKLCKFSADLFYIRENKPRQFTVISGKMTVRYEPAMVDFSHGRKKMTLPSDVDGSSNPMFDGLRTTHTHTHTDKLITTQRKINNYLI